MNPEKASSHSVPRALAEVPTTVNATDLMLQKDSRLLSEKAGVLNGGFPSQGYIFGGPHNKDSSILGSLLRSPYVGKLPNVFFAVVFSSSEGQSALCLSLPQVLVEP